ncbi:phage tail protein [Brevibacillus composti]|uniref:Phage tail protein n=1 Tax=Brevibacillus composti TaxID=2796470 RepID=A0A7T5ENC1_9BACL|nr:phage tail protein [Brevibacillus composti]QQE75731.1 phage tail protein [Brevibacillus composti]QUO42757.1 phage tail protein [Brevibacillus composti]
MGQYNGAVLTEKGLQLQTKAQMGARLQFTRIAIGDGYPSGSLTTMTELVNETMSLPILELKNLGAGQTQVKAMVSNQELTEGIYVREIGLFANDPDIGEILYAVANAGALADYLPPPNGTDVVEEIVQFITVVGTASDVTAVIDSQAAVTVTTFNEHVNDSNIHITRAEFDAAISSLRNEVQLIKSTFPDSFTNNLFTEDLVTIDAIVLTHGYYNEAQSRLEV